MYRFFFKHFLLLGILLAVLLSNNSAVAQKFGQNYWRYGAELAGFHLVIPEDSSDEIKTAGKTFQKLWKSAMKREISLSNINEGMTNVWLGSTSIPNDLIPQEELARLNPEEFLIRTFTPTTRDAIRGVQKHLLFTGGTDLAVRYGIYTFFSRYCSISWLTPSEVYYAPPPTGIPEITLKWRPAFAVREIGLLGYGQEKNKEFRIAHKLTPDFLPLPGREDYFENYQNQDGNRTKHLSLGSQEGAEMVVREIMALQKQMEETGTHSGGLRHAWRLPGETIWLLCTFDQFTPVLSEEGYILNEREDSPAAAIIHTANMVAQLLTQQLPSERHSIHVLLSPSVYTPPKELRPSRNVIVQISTAACDFSSPLVRKSNPQNSAFVNLLDGWRRLGTRLHIYDFLVNHYNPQLPFPNLRVLFDNIHFYIQKACEGIYFACPHSDVLTWELTPLRTYLAVSAMFDPDNDYNELLSAFLDAYYGNQASTIVAYNTLMESALQSSGMPLTPYDRCTWLSYDVINKATDLLQTAISSESKDTAKKRVETLLEAINKANELQ